MDTQMAREFFYAVSYSAMMNLHLKVLYGENDHHMLEAMFNYSFERAWLGWKQASFFGIVFLFCGVVLLWLIPKVGKVDKTKRDSIVCYKHGIVQLTRPLRRTTKGSIPRCFSPAFSV